ncbi:aromatic prenyltransferase [Streptomyces sp. CMB-StM0423]|uniref:aromatic prenyltransferase n=1 Tax=Streptomyces sp. CMB-StM0423 TaxID=2059884 RepID=UPI000C6FE0B5|nr:aromatic prenyltransferase [Streptomyces sp. CMB-StM0423]AUH39958.1 prenyltransferase [Streptomyces sp. CMB-StM0423]
MSATAEMDELYSVIEHSARTLGVPCAPATVRPVLAAYADAFGHDATVVAFRVATSLRHAGELDCRFTTHPGQRDPYAAALAAGLTAPTDHPVGAVLAQLHGRCRVDSHGVDFGVVGGFKKVYAFFTPDDLQDVAKFADLPAMPPALAAHAGFLARHGLADRVGVVGVDYRHRTLNVYFNDVPPRLFEPEAITAVLRELGMATPSAHMLKLGREAFGLYVTLGWDSPRVERICYAVTTPDLAALPVRVDPETERFVRGVPAGDGDRKFVYGVAVAPGGEYYKLESHYRWKAGTMDFI